MYRRNSLFQMFGDVSTKWQGEKQYKENKK